MQVQFKYNKIMQPYKKIVLKSQFLTIQINISLLIGLITFFVFLKYKLIEFGPLKNKIQFWSLQNQNKDQINFGLKFNFYPNDNKSEQ